MFRKSMLLFGKGPMTVFDHPREDELIGARNSFFWETRQANCFTLFQMVQQALIRSMAFTNRLISDEGNMRGDTRGTIEFRAKT